MKIGLVGTLFVLLAGSCDGAGSTSRPIIGILTVPTFKQCEDEPAPTGAALGPLSNEFDCYIPAGYVKLVESGGARAALLPCRVNDRFHEILKSVNGFLISGMFTDYQCRSSPAGALTEYGTAGRAVIEHVQAEHLPLFAECKGFNMLLFIISGEAHWTDIIRDDIDSTDQAAPIHWNTKAGFVPSSTQVYKAAAKLNAASLLTTGENLMNRHPYGILPGNYTRLANITRVFGDYVATTIDKKGVEYVSVVEALRTPIIGAATHPEKILFQWTLGLETPHTADAVRLNMLWGEWLVDKARQNARAFASAAQEQASLVYNQTTNQLFDSTGIIGGNFMQLYFTERSSSAASTTPAPACISAAVPSGHLAVGVGVGLAVGLPLAAGVALLVRGYSRNSKHAAVSGGAADYREM